MTSSKREFWNGVRYVNCPVKGCDHTTKVRSALIHHLGRVHNITPYEKARDMADATGIYIPKMYRRKEASR